MQLERALDRLDGAIDAGAIAARSGEKKFFGTCTASDGRSRACSSAPFVTPRRSWPRSRTVPSGLPSTPTRCAPRSALELTDDGVAPEHVIDELVAGADPGIVATRRAALLRLRHRRRAARGAGGGLADLGVGPERAHVGRLARRLGRRGGRRGLGAVAARAAGDASVGLRHRRADGQRRPASRSARDACSSAPAGTSRRQGLIGAPPLTVVAAQEAHATVFSALRLLGLGRDAAASWPRTTQGAMEPDALARELGRRPGDRLRAGGQRQHRRVRPAASRSRTRASSAARGCTSTARSACGRRRRRRTAHLTRGLERADSLGHRRPQVAQRPVRRRPGDRRATAPRTARRWRSAPRTSSPATQRDNYDYTPEASRRARGFALYAALRSLGRAGSPSSSSATARRPRASPSCCATAAPRSSTTSCSTRCSSPRRRARSRAIQADGTCWVGGTVWRGREAIRISVSNWATTDADVERSAAAILRALSGS